MSGFAGSIFPAMSWAMTKSFSSGGEGIRSKDAASSSLSRVSCAEAMTGDTRAVDPSRSIEEDADVEKTAARRTAETAWNQVVGLGLSQLLMIMPLFPFG